MPGDETDPAQRIIDAAGWGPGGGLGWIRCMVPADASEASEYTAEIAAGAFCTVGELLERLRFVPRETPLLVPGYEGGYTPPSGLSVTEVQQLAGMPDSMGAYLAPADAQRELRGCGESGWQATVDGAPPAPVGGPVYAVVLYR